MIEFAAVVKLRTGADRYAALVGARLRAARLAADWTLDRLADGLTDVLGVKVSPEQLARWEEGDEEFRAGYLPAAYDVMGMSEAEAIGLRNPDAAEVSRLAVAVAKVRGLLNDPAALMRRASELLDGRAQPFLVLAVVALLGIRIFGGPILHTYSMHPRRASAVAARADIEKG